MKFTIKILGAIFLVSLIIACSTTDKGDDNGNGNGGGTSSGKATHMLLGMVAPFTGVAEFANMGSGLPGFAPYQRSRIPAIFTLRDGTVLAGGDARRPHNGDSPNNIDSFVRISTDDGKTWGSAIFNHLNEDYSKSHPTSGENLSTSFIDSTLGQAEDGTIVSMVNQFIGGGGIQGGIGRPQSSPFFDKDGKRYLLLVNTEDWAAPANTSTADKIELFTNVVLLGNATIKNGIPTDVSESFDDPATKRSLIKGLNADKTIGNAVTVAGSSKWEIDEFWQLYKDGQKVMIDKRHNGDPDPKTHAVVTYQEAPFRSVNNTYAFVAFATAASKGDTWTRSKEVSWHFRYSEGEGVVGSGSFSDNTPQAFARQHYIVSPGRLHTMATGTHKGRIFSVLYAFPRERGLTVFSDDEGKTWQRGGSMENLIPGAGRASETQIADAPDGTVLAFARSGGGIAMYQSTDGGMTWSTGWDTGLFDGASNGTMVSAINLRLTEGLSGEALMAFSFPDINNRNNGAVRITQLKKVGADWRVLYNANDGTTIVNMITHVGLDADDAMAKRFGYSTITELANGNIGLLSDGFDSSVLEYYEIGLNRIEK